MKVPSVLAAAILFPFLSAESLRAQEPASLQKAAAKSAVQMKAERLILKDIKFAEAGIKDVVDHLRSTVLKVDGEEKGGVNIVLHSGKEKVPDISMEVRNVCAWDILQAIAKTTGLHMAVVGDAIVIHSEALTPRERKAPGLTDSSGWKSLAAVKVEHIRFEEADFEMVHSHCKRKTEQAGGILNLLNAGGNSTEVTMDLRHLSISSVLELAVELTGQEITAVGDILILRPPPEYGRKPEEALEWMKSDVWKRAGEITLPRVSFSGADGNEAADYLTKKSKEEDKAKRGVSVEIDGVASSGMTFDVREVKLSNLLLALAELHWLKIGVKDDTISLFPCPELVGRRNAEEIIIPKLDFRDMNLNECVTLIVHQSQQEGPNGPRGIGVLNNHNKFDGKITLSVEKGSAWNAMKKLAEAAGARLIMEGYKLAIVPAR